MHLHEELLSLGFAGGAERLDTIVCFLENEGFDSVDELAGAPRARTFKGADALESEELLFLQRVCCVVRCIILLCKNHL